jgi:hypothetical protein
MVKGSVSSVDKRSVSLMVKGSVSSVVKGSVSSVVKESVSSVVKGFQDEYTVARFSSVSTYSRSVRPVKLKDRIWNMLYFHFKFVTPCYSPPAEHCF